jgi:DNA-binding NarL/FixJ family response regulator
MTAPLLNLFLVDEDPVFRMGLRIWLEQRPEFAIAGEASTGEDTLAQVTRLRAAAASAATDAGADVEADAEGC